MIVEVAHTGPATSGPSSPPNLDSTLADALQDSLQAEARASHADAAPPAAKAIASAVSQGIDDSSLAQTPSPVMPSPFASRAAAQGATSEDLTSAEADTAIAANLRRTLNRLNTLSLPVATVTAKPDALPVPADLPAQVSNMLLLESRLTLLPLAAWSFVNLLQQQLYPTHVLRAYNRTCKLLQMQLPLSAPYACGLLRVRGLLLLYCYLFTQTCNILLTCVKLRLLAQAGTSAEGPKGSGATGASSRRSSLHKPSSMYGQQVGTHATMSHSKSSMLHQQRYTGMLRAGRFWKRLDMPCSYLAPNILGFRVHI